MYGRGDGRGVSSELEIKAFRERIQTTRRIQIRRIDALIGSGKGDPSAHSDRLDDLAAWFRLQLKAVLKHLLDCCVDGVLPLLAGGVDGKHGEAMAAVSQVDGGVELLAGCDGVLLHPIHPTAPCERRYR